MSYENAPSTLMLATHCAICARPLRDAKSVDLGIGPDCRRKYGFDAEIPEEARVEANKIIHALALHRGGQADRGPTYPPEAIARVRELGLPTLASILTERMAVVSVKKLDDGRIGVHSPYSEEAVSAFRAVPGRMWAGEGKMNTYPDERTVKAQLWATIKRLYRGELVSLPDGRIIVAQ